MNKKVTPITLILQIIPKVIRVLCQEPDIFFIISQWHIAKISVTCSQFINVCVCVYSYWIWT